MLNAYKQSWLPLLAGIALTLLFILLYLNEKPGVKDFLQRLEAIPYDQRIKFTTPAEIRDTPPIIIVDIDDLSLKQEGRWPWSRRRISELIDRLVEQNAAVIAFDISFSEPEENPVDIILNNQPEEKPAWLAEMRGQLDADAQLSRTIQHYTSDDIGVGIVLGYTFYRTSITDGAIKQTPIVADTQEIERITASSMNGYSGNLEGFTKAASSTGFVTVQPDSDGSIRRAPLVLEYDGELYPSLALEAARAYFTDERIQVNTANIGAIRNVTSLVIGGEAIKTDPLGRILIPYRGRKQSFPTISATDVLHGRIKPEMLQDAIVLVGTSVLALADLRTTPVQVSFPGVEIHASIVHALMNPDIIPYPPEFEVAVMVLILFLTGLLMLLTYPLMGPRVLLVSGLMLLLLSLGANLVLWTEYRISLPVMVELLLVFSVTAIFIGASLIRENRSRNQIHTMFGQYVPMQHIDRMLVDPASASMDGERREMSVLFSDIRNFTALSEHLSTRELKQFLNNYLTPITEIIFSHQGTVDKYVGDLVMAFWGAPLADKDHAQHAVETALEMQRKIRSMQPEFEKLGIHDLSAGIGIHTGEMNVGDMGSSYRRAYTVLGDAVNLGSRLEGLTKYYGIDILVSEETKSDAPGYRYRFIDHVRVKGRDEPLKIFEPLQPEAAPSLERWEKAMQCYRSGEWQQAAKILEKLQQQSDHRLYRLYLKRIDTLLANPPQEWNSVHNHIAK